MNAAERILAQEPDQEAPIVDPDEPEADPEPEAAPDLPFNIGIKAFLKTLEGKRVVESQKPFIVEGKVWQGFGQIAVMVDADQPTMREIKAARDIDGTKHLVLADRQRREDGLAVLKRQELAERQSKVTAKSRDEIQLEILQMELAEKRKAAGLKVEQVPKVGIGEFVCASCSATFETARQLHGHRMGAHRIEK